MQQSAEALCPWSVSYRSGPYLDELDGQGALPHPSSSHHHQFESFLVSAHPGFELGSVLIKNLPGPESRLSSATSS